jgi:hypothetical protein
VLWANYQKLKTNIVPVAPEEKEFKMVSKYLRQTHAPSHSQYSLELLDLFKIDREGEMARYEKWAKLHNRMVRVCRVRVVCGDAWTDEAIALAAPVAWFAIDQLGRNPVARPAHRAARGSFDWLHGTMVITQHGLRTGHHTQPSSHSGRVVDSLARESTLRTWRASRPTTASHRARTMWAS